MRCLKIHISPMTSHAYPLKKLYFGFQMSRQLCIYYLACCFYAENRAMACWNAMARQTCLHKLDKSRGICLMEGRGHQYYMEAYTKEQAQE